MSSSVFIRVNYGPAAGRKERYSPSPPLQPITTHTPSESSNRRTEPTELWITRGFMLVFQMEKWKMDQISSFRQRLQMEVRHLSWRGHSEPGLLYTLFCNKIKTQGNEVHPVLM